MALIILKYCQTSNLYSLCVQHAAVLYESRDFFTGSFLHRYSNLFFFCNSFAYIMSVSIRHVRLGGLYIYIYGVRRIL